MVNSLQAYEVIDIFDNGDSYLKAVLAAVTNAKKSIYVESYIFELPDPGNTILNLLAEKHKQGLEVKLMVDGVGSFKDLEALQQWSKDTLVPLRIYNRLPLKYRWQWIFFPFFLIKMILNTRLLNKRAHRKIVIVDGECAFIGSINFAASHFSAYSQISWFDLAVQVQGSFISTLEQSCLFEFHYKKPTSINFWNDFSLAFRTDPKWPPMTHQIRLNNNFVLRYLYWRDLLQRIRNAKSRVYIMNAYFVPHQSLLRSLKVAARNGVEVVLLLPSISDVPFIKWFAPIFYKKLIHGKAEVRELQNQIAHAKSIIIDDWALVGSNNLNYRSLFHDLEVEAVVDSNPMMQRLLDIWKAKIAESKIIHLQDVLNLSWIAWIQYRLVLLIRYFV